ncbi:unnamed protein product [Peronospora belbahrii]|uniref:GRIP domain-containing protein n=1 Tax=Peronospora belbahrii TaxID=622444 RepID=A0AAU9L238_9STRA|nr:unnamed protein product [Peronospora belbahrii]CAH0513478.1 unnamed protein product [Peronospora belbahrii]
MEDLQQQQQQQEEEEEEEEQQQQQETSEQQQQATASILSSNGVFVDVERQMKSWKERCDSMEKILAKNKVKMQEMKETENKLKRLLTMAKRSIDNSKQELVEKDKAIQKLQMELAKSQQAKHSWYVDESTPDPRKLLYKVAQGNSIWCLVEYANDCELDDSKEFAWHCFKSEKEIQAYANRVSGEPLVLPDFSMTPFEVERVKKSLKEEINRVQEEFRRYRVRSEITRKQKDADIRKISANVIAKQTEQISEVDIAGELQSSKAQVRRLTKAQAEAEERELILRRKFEKLMKDYEKLSGTMGETVLAMEWRERYEQSAREKQELEKRLEELKLMMNGAFDKSHDRGNGDLQSLRQEFAQYRKSALNAVEQKEKQLNDIQEQYHVNGGGSIVSRANSSMEIGARRMSVESNSSLLGFDTPNSTRTNEYLKNIVYKYMSSDQDEAKEHMEKAIATVLNFTPAEVASIQEKRKQHGWFW